MLFYSAEALKQKHTKTVLKKYIRESKHYTNFDIYE